MALSGQRMRRPGRGGRRVDCGDQGFWRIGRFGRTNIWRVRECRIGVRSGGFVEGGRGFALGDKRGIEERADLVEGNAQRGVFDQSRANDFCVGSRKFGKYETAGWTLLGQNFA